VYIATKAIHFPTFVFGHTSPNPIQNIVLKVSQNAFSIDSTEGLYLYYTIRKPLVHKRAQAKNIEKSFKR